MTPVTIQRLNELTLGFADRKIAVIGDFFLDRYVEFDPALAEISLETGKTANQVVNVRHSPGGAGNIANNLSSLGARSIRVAGFVGDDGSGYELGQDLMRLGCNTEHLHRIAERYTPAYLKPRNISISGLEGESERYDTMNRLPLPEYVERNLVQALADVTPLVDGVVIVDQVDEEGCGAITVRVRQAIEEIAGRHPEVVFWVDSRQRIGQFRNCILKPNQYEAVNAVFPGTGHGYDRLRVMESGRTLNERTGKPVFLTVSEQGMLVFNDGGCEAVPGVRVEGPIDPTGAGDSATAGAVMSLTSGGTLLESALVANLVAAVTVRQIGRTGTASVGDLLGQLESLSHPCIAHTV